MKLDRDVSKPSSVPHQMNRQPKWIKTAFAFVNLYHIYIQSGKKIIEKQITRIGYFYNTIFTRNKS